MKEDEIIRLKANSTYKTPTSIIRSRNIHESHGKHQNANMAQRYYERTDYYGNDKGSR